jgi:glycosyltransferase involved in cell wall biosynthesis
MRIVIDLQACQTTGSRHRGIGRYSLSLTKAMLANVGQHEIHLMLSGLFPETIAPLRQSFSGLLPADHIHIWQAPGPVAELQEANFWRCRSAELLREQAIANLRPDIVHVTSLFEGSGDNAVTSIGQNGEYVPNAVTLYDLIPFIHAEHYLIDEGQRAWYFRKLASLRRADISFAISESSRREGIDYLNIPSHKVLNISSAVDTHFVPRDKDSGHSQVPEKYGITRPYIMYTGGIDLRKNIDGLVRAYAQLPAQMRSQYQLAIVCNVQDADRSRLLQLAMKNGLRQDDLILTGYVSDQEMVLLYQFCTLFVFPSWHEGFGLPALEAMSCGAPVIAANTSSLPEVIGRADALFDPHQDYSITAKLHEVLSNKSFREELVEHALNQSTKFSWDQSAKKAIAGFEQIYLETKPRPSKKDAKAIRPRLAYFSPLPKLESGVAVFSAQLLPALSCYYDIDLIVDQNSVDDFWLNANFKIRDVIWFEHHAHQFDRIIYNLGNSPFHAYMLKMLHQFPGVVILHDFYLSGLYSFVQQINFNKNIFEQVLYQSHGYPALLEKQNVNGIEQVIWNYPSNFSVLDRADGVIVHSDFSVQLAKQWYGSKLTQSFKKIPHFHQIPAVKNRARARAALGIHEGEFLVCSFGFLGETKLNKAVLNAWINSPMLADKKAKLVFVGQTDGSLYCKELLATIEALARYGNIEVTGYVSSTLFNTYLEAADVAVQLRGNSRGEASYTVLDCLAYGIPTIVNDHGSMKEMPAHALVKLHEAFSQNDLISAIAELRNNPLLRIELAKSGLKYVQQNCDIEIIAGKYFSNIESFFLSEPRARLKRTIQKIADLETTRPIDENDVMQVSHSLAVNQTIGVENKILLDISEFELLNGKHGAQELRKLLSTFLVLLFNKLPKKIRVEPVVMRQVENSVALFYARQLTCSLLEILNTDLIDEVVECQSTNFLIALKNSNHEGAMTKDSKWLSHLQLMSRSEINVRTYMDEQQGNCEKAAQQLFDVFWQEVSADGRFSVLQF